MEETKRIDAEWVALNAFRGLTKIASRNDMEKSTYDNTLEFAGHLYPDLLGPDVSVLKREREYEVTKEYRQKAELYSIRDNVEVTALELLLKDITDLESLLSLEQARKNRQKVDQLKRKLSQLNKARDELEPVKHSENQLIFRDAYNVQRSIPTLTHGQGYKDFRLPNDNVLRVRVLHPDKPEHITGADIIYERHSVKNEKASIVAVQYKIWEERKLYLSDERMKQQLERMKAFLCDRDVCKNNSNTDYRFPCCSAFLRPTDKLQKPDQKFISTGEHIPICRINECKTIGINGGELLEYKKMKDISLSNDMFEFLFNKGKIGSGYIDYEKLKILYSDFLDSSSIDRVVIYAQEFK